MKPTTETAEPSQVAPATCEDTRKALLKRAKRAETPILKAFVQNPNKRAAIRNAPLAGFVNRRDLAGLQAFLFTHAIMSNGEKGWDAAHPLAVWSRALGIEGQGSAAATSKILGRLVREKLITKKRGGGNVVITLLRPDGSGEPYTRPAHGNTDRFLKLDNRYWTDGWFESLSLAGTAMLLVALHERPGFELPTERLPEWYGWSADTAERGFKELRELDLLQVDKELRTAPLSKTGLMQVNKYTLLKPFGNPPTAADDFKAADIEDMQQAEPEPKTTKKPVKKKEPKNG